MGTPSTLSFLVELLLQLIDVKLGYFTLWTETNGMAYQMSCNEFSVSDPRLF